MANRLCAINIFGGFLVNFDFEPSQFGSAFFAELSTS